MAPWHEIADKFNEYFTTIGSELTKDVPTVTKQPEDYIDAIYFKLNVFSTYIHRWDKIIIEKKTLQSWIG